MKLNPTPPRNGPLPASPSGRNEPEPAPRRAFSAELRYLASQFGERPATLGALLAATQGRGIDLLLLLLALPFLTPIPLLGLSTPFGLVVGLIGMRLAVGRRPWLPQRLLDLRSAEPNLASDRAAWLWLPLRPPR